MAFVPGLPWWWSDHGSAMGEVGVALVPGQVRGRWRWCWCLGAGVGGAVANPGDSGCAGVAGSVHGDHLPVYQGANLRTTPWIYQRNLRRAAGAGTHRPQPPHQTLG